MYTKDYYIKKIQGKVISFNEYWEDPITESQLYKDPIKSAEIIISYCNVLKILYKNNNYPKDYTKLPVDVTSMIDKIVNIVNDGRDLYHKVYYPKVDRKYDHHVQENGRLGFENNCVSSLPYLIDDCEKLIETVKSSEETEDFTIFNRRCFEWCYYEDGSFILRIDKINRDKNGDFTFDGAILHYCTIDSWADRSGILFEEVDDYKFKDLPYPNGKIDTPSQLVAFLKSGTEKTMKEIEEEIKNAISNYFYGEFFMNF
jgi:hypothetical protein